MAKSLLKELNQINYVILMFIRLSKKKKDSLIQQKANSILLYFLKCNVSVPAGIFLDQRHFQRMDRMRRPWQNLTETLIKIKFVYF